MQSRDPGQGTNGAVEDNLSFQMLKVSSGELTKQVSSGELTKPGGTDGGHIWSHMTLVPRALKYGHNQALREKNT